MNRLSAGLALAAAALSSPLAARPAPMPWPVGLYSDVHTIEETGDLLGFEARFYIQAGRRMVEFAYCEGWCNEAYVAEVTRGDNGFMFAPPGSENGARELHFVVWPVGRTLGYSVYQGRENIDTSGKPGRLRRTAKPFGIAVAKSGKE